MKDIKESLLTFWKKFDIKNAAVRVIANYS